MALHLSIAVASAAFAATVLALVAPAWADVIDGDWCQADGRHMAIKGPDIVTPGGTRTVGNYSRHSFSYTVPQADPGAGKTVMMILVNELTVNMRMGADAADAAKGQAEVWHRCAPPTSELGAGAHAA
ncbi:MAG: hypothetical protein ACHQF3_16005 [Alphaproteobacteria bacterium]